MPLFPAAAPAARRRNVALLLNAQARQVTAQVIAPLSALVGEEHVFCSTTLAQAEAMADAIAQRGYDVVAAGGGDGTLVHAIQCVRAACSRRGNKVPAFAFLALGTGNAFEHVLHASTPLADLARLVYAPLLPLRPLACIEQEGGGAFFFGGLGYDSLLLADYNALRKQLSWPIFRSLLGYAAAVGWSTLPRVVRGAPLFEATVRSVGDAWYFDPNRNDEPKRIGRDVLLHAGPADLVAMGTVAYFGYGLRLFPFVDRVPGTMHLRVARCSAARVLSDLPRLWRGTLRDPERLQDFAVQGVDIALRAPFAFEHSGDDQGPVQHLRLQVRPEAIMMVDYSPGVAADLRAS